MISNGNNKFPPVIGITMGDPAGVGPEIVVSALSNPAVYQICRPLIIGDLNIIRKAVASLGAPLAPEPVWSPENAAFKFGHPDIISISNFDAERLVPAVATPEAGKATIEYVALAVRLALKKSIAGIVTAPITKTALKMACCQFPGHTEMLAHLTGTTDYAMMLTGDTLKVILVTIHIPLSRVPGTINRRNILKTIGIADISLKERFGISTPRIGVAGLNPHASEDSMFGTEEKNIIKPAVIAARANGIDVSGPFSPDTVFHDAAKGRFHCVVAMYHDQGLIPFKTIHFNTGVNTTLGLPVIRTSVDHGTAFDIAWKGRADATSLVEAIKSAALQAANHKEQKQWT